MRFNIERNLCYGVSMLTGLSLIVLVTDFIFRSVWFTIARYPELEMEDSHRQMRILFRINGNHCGQLIRNIFGSLRISLGRLRITC